MTTMAPEPRIAFNSVAFVEAVYTAISACAEEPERLGRPRLHAALYYADMCMYMTEGAPITGEEYIKESFGPAARHLGVTLDLLQADGQISVDRVVHHGVPRTVIALVPGARAPTTLSNAIGADAHEMITFWAQWVCGLNNTDLSDTGLRRPWESVRRLGDTIPYPTAFMMLPRPTFRREVERKAS